MSAHPAKTDRAKSRALALVKPATPSTAQRANKSWVDFQPDVVELEERAPPRLASAALYAMLVFIAAAIGWACVSRIDIIVTAPGRLITSKPNIVVQPLETSLIRTIEVSRGDIVKAGQVLARLDSTFSKADVDGLLNKSKALSAKIARIDAELAGKTYSVSAESGPDEQLQAKLFLQRKANFIAQIDNLDESIARAQAALVTGGSERDVLEKRRGTLKQISDMRATLFESQNGSKINMLQSQEQSLEIESSLAHIVGGLVEAEHTIEKTRAERRTFEEDFRRQSLEQLIDAWAEKNDADEQIKKAKLREEKIDLKSPMDAVVLDIAARSVGSVVREAEPLLTLVPLDVPIEAEVAIGGRDIGYVEAGQQVRIKFDTFPFQVYGTARGVIRTVSRDAFSPENSQEKDAGAAAHFRARVDLTDVKLRGLPSGFRLLPGMTISGEIKTGDRTIISYFLSPFLKSLDESIRER